MPRTTPRVILRHPRRGSFGEDDVLVLEMGLGGAKFEHPHRFDVNRMATFVCGPLRTQGTVRHSVMLPALEGVVYQSGIEFTAVGDDERTLLLDLIAHEAEKQVAEWEANVRGEMPPRPSKTVPRSALAPRYVLLRLTEKGWQRTVTSDPNQPIDGVSVIEGTPEEEITKLRLTYQRGDEAMRELLRSMAMQAIVEHIRDRGRPQR